MAIDIQQCATDLEAIATLLKSNPTPVSISTVGLNVSPRISGNFGGGSFVGYQSNVSIPSDFSGTVHTLAGTIVNTNISDNTLAQAKAKSCNQDQQILEEILRVANEMRSTNTISPGWLKSALDRASNLGNTVISAAITTFLTKYLS